MQQVDAIMNEWQGMMNYYIQNNEFDKANSYSRKCFAMALTLYSAELISEKAYDVLKTYDRQLFNQLIAAQFPRSSEATAQ